MKLAAYSCYFVPIFILMLHSALGQMLYEKEENKCGVELRLRQNDIDNINCKQEVRELRSDIESVKMQIESSRHYLPVYFSAWNTQTLTKIKTGTTIVYDKVLTNEGNGYSNVNGKFTAPRDGPYVFAWTVVVKDNFMINIFIYHNGNRLSVAQADSEYNNLNNSGSNTIVLNLKKNDVVQLKCGRMGTVRKNYLHGNGHSTFSGWLL